MLIKTAMVRGFHTQQVCVFVADDGEGVLMEHVMLGKCTGDTYLQGFDRFIVPPEKS